MEVRGSLEAGRAPAGLCYGYDMVKGEERGRRTINQEQAEIIRRIMREYIEGKSPKTIAKGLNANGIRSARGGNWQASAINGNRKRASGILENPIYMGKRVFGRQIYKKDPMTGKTVAKDAPKEEWLYKNVPQLAIVSKQLWEQVRARKDIVRPNLNQSHRPKYLLSGLLKCGACGGPYSIIQKNRYGCSHRRTRGTCENALRITGSDAENRVLAAIGKYLRDPEYIQTFIRAYKEEWERLNGNKNNDRTRVSTAITRCNLQINNILGVIERSQSVALLDRLSAREAELKKL